jgi:hypothetical protein
MQEVSRKNPRTFSFKQKARYINSILSPLVGKTPASHLAFEVFFLPAPITWGKTVHI